MYKNQINLHAKKHLNTFIKSIFELLKKNFSHKRPMDHIAHLSSSF